MQDDSGKKGNNKQSTPLTVASSTCSTSQSTLAVALPSSSGLQSRGRNQHFLHQLQLLGILSLASFGVFLIYALPATALVALAIFVSSTSSLVYVVYQNALVEWQSILRGRGVENYLPGSLYHQLAETSLHEWMMDSSFYLEYRYFILYFVPGITQEQLDSFLNRLAPRHRETLHRPMGQLLGDDFMRILLGESRWPPRENAIPELMLDGTSTARQLFHAREEDQSDDESRSNDIGLDITASDLAGDINDRQASALGRFVGLAGNGQIVHGIGREEQGSREAVVEAHNGPAIDNLTPQQVQQHEYNEEQVVLGEAFTAMVANYTSMASDAVSAAAAQTVEYLSPFVIQTGFGVSFLSAGVGLFGTWVGAYHPWRVSLTSPPFPPSRSLWITGIFGGATAGIVVLIRAGVRRMLQNSRIEDGKTE